LVLSYVGIKYAGYIGAAWAHLFVSAFFAIVFLFYVHGRAIPVSLGKLYKQAYQPTIVPLFTLLIASAIFSKRPVLDLPWFVGAMAFTTVILLGYAWAVICMPHHHAPLRYFLMSRLKLSGNKA
jgi:hypothetical protein